MLVLSVLSVPPSHLQVTLIHVPLAQLATPLLVQAVTLPTYARSALQVPIQLAAEVHAWLYPVLLFAVLALT